jgi:hypothetical protein
MSSDINAGKYAGTHAEKMKEESDVKNADFHN